MSETKSAYVVEEIEDTSETITTPLIDELDSAEAEIPAPAHADFPDAEEAPAPDEPETAAAPEPEPVLLDLMQIGKQLGVTYSRIRRFAEAPGVAEALGARRVKGVQGWRYPEESVGKWKQLMVEADKGLLTPKTAGAWLANQTTEPAPAETEETGIATIPGTLAPSVPAGNTSAAALVGLMGEMALGIDENAMARIAPAQILAAMVRLAETLERNADAQAAIATPREPERWYTLVGAAEATGMSQKTIRENVPHVVEGTRKKWSGRDLAAFQERAERHSK